MVTEAINTAKAAGATDILVRGDAAYGVTAVISAALRAKVTFSLVLTRQPSVNRAIDSIPADAGVPVQYLGAVKDPDTGAWISNAEVADVLAYFDRPGTSNGPTEAINGRLETPPRLRPLLPQPHQLHRQITPRNRRLQTRVHRGL